MQRAPSGVGRKNGIMPVQSEAAGRASGSPR